MIITASGTARLLLSVYTSREYIFKQMLFFAEFFSPEYQVGDLYLPELFVQ